MKSFYLIKLFWYHFKNGIKCYKIYNKIYSILFIHRWVLQRVLILKKYSWNHGLSLNWGNIYHFNLNKISKFISKIALQKLTKNETKIRTASRTDVGVNAYRLAFEFYIERDLSVYINTYYLFINSFISCKIKEKTFWIGDNKKSNECSFEMKWR